uniref:Uncharacterized protein n=1 Tax=Rhizophora mucronata TaxID=61149 RepID=A0A2P2LSS1_RHIMU
MGDSGNQNKDREIWE